MELSELTDDELLTLVALVKLVVRADRVATHAERDEVRILRDAVGADRWNDAATMSKEAIPSRKALRRRIKALSHQASRELIHAQLVRLSAADQIHPNEVQILSWLAELWDIQRAPEPK